MIDRRIFYVRCNNNNNLLMFAACPNLAKVTERKHRLVKAAALFVFRSLEHTTLAHILNAQCEQVIEGHSLFQKRFLVRPSHLDISDLRRTSSLWFWSVG